MKSLMKVLSLSAVALVFSLATLGCGGPDNEKTMMTNPDGTPSKVEGTQTPSSAEDYNSKTKVGGPAEGYTDRKKKKN